MSDVRALLAAEKQSRRISHPHLTYSKSGALNCNVCNLNIRSEQLWPGHLKSLNHRKNAQKASTEASRPTKRKIESVEPADEEERNYDVDSRKKPKPTIDAILESRSDQDFTTSSVQDNVIPPVTEESTHTQKEQQVSVQIIQPTPAESSENVDEDEWAAFEREVGPLAHQDYSSATIEAAPVSAAEVAAQQKTNAVQERENEAEAEKEDESRRMEEEFEVMEEMEDRVNRLRARREALRSQDARHHPENAPKGEEDASNDLRREAAAVVEDGASSEEDEVDDWYG